MEDNLISVQQLNPQNFEFQDYIDSDQALIASSDLDTVFNQETDYIEFCVYDENQIKIFPLNSAIQLNSYNVLEGDVNLYPKKDLQDLGYDDSTYNILYNFYRKRLSSSITSKYYIKEISSDRTEIRLDSNTISNLDIISSTNEFIQYRDSSEYFVDFLLNFGDNKTVIANNIKLEDEDTDDPTILIKLYEPLPNEFITKSSLWVVEEISTAQMYKVTFPFTPIEENDFSFIGGPNFNLSVKDESGKTGQEHSFDSLFNTSLTSSATQLESLLSSSNIDINVNYEQFSEFVNFSSAKTRLENFIYKAGRIEYYNNLISNSLGSIGGATTGSSAYSASKAIYEQNIKDIIHNFDGYDYFLYYNSGSSFSYPKSNSTQPYNLYSTGSTEVLQWLGSADPDNQYYGGLALSASNYDQENQDYLYWAIPEYLRDDPSNNQYKLFVDMVAQQYDNTWLLTKDLTNKFDTDNRLEYGISKDLVSEAIKDFGIKLYSNNFNTTDLYTAFLGLTPSGSLFPFPEITGSLPTPSGFEYVDTKISSSNDPIALNGIEKRIYKRIYHNLPYLLKTKGTAAGLRALITSYGIPDTILRINEFGGKDRINSQDWDLKQKVFNYAFDTEGKYIVSSSFNPNTNFGGLQSPRTVQLRIKTRGIPSSTHLSQSLYHIQSDRSALVLEYTGSGLASGSYSGSIPNPENKYGTLKFIPDVSANPNISASLYLPFFDGNWWSIQTTVNNDHTASLHAANQINNDLGFNESSTVSGFNSAYYFDAGEVYFPTDGDDLSIGSKSYTLFSGSYQEIRYYKSVIDSNVFYDYTMNPYSFEGNSTNNAPEDLIFRADLGTLLNTGSTTSVHPKVTGSSVYTTESFASNSNFYISSSNFISNKETIHQDQVIGGIKNRITDKITTNDIIFPSGNTLSPLISLQQESFESSSYTPNADYLEVAFSPQDQINDDINSQMGYFNIGEYIGDPRHISQSNTNYPDLDTLRDAYFSKYISSYDLVDFIRLMKFFDNSLFKMIKDFTPARTSLSSGVVIKQHILERNRVRPPQASYSNVTYSGSIKPQSRNYNTGSGDVGQYSYNSGSSIYTFKGGTGGSFERFNGLETSPSASDYNLNNKFGLTQSYQEYKEGKLGRELITTFDQKEFYDGEFSGSELIATTQSLNPGCLVYLKNPDKPLNFFPYFYSDPETDVIFGTVKNLDWQDKDNAPLQGQAWFYSKRNPSNIDEVKFIKIASSDINGNEVRDFLLGAETIQFAFSGVVNDNTGLNIPGGIKTYFVDGVQIFSTFALVRVRQNAGDYLYASDDNGGTENWSLRVYGDASSSLDTSVAGTDYNSQGVFRAVSTFQRQFFRYYNGSGSHIENGGIGDPLNNFNTGSPDFTSTNLLNNSTGFNFGTYNLPRTPNIPLVISCSLVYSASGGEAVDESISTQGIYHTGSFYGANSTDQDVRIAGTKTNAVANGIYVSRNGYATQTEAEEVAADRLVYFTGSAGSTATAPILGNSVYVLNYNESIRTSPGQKSLSNIFNGSGLWRKIGDNHVAQISSTGLVSNLTAINPTPVNPSPVLANYGYSGSFALPSIDVNALSMDSTYFNTTVNQNLPAYSGSNKAEGAGAIQLNHNSSEPGTGSLFWDHSQYTLGGLPPLPVPNPNTVQFKQFSGSAAIATNADFSNYGGNIDPTYENFNDTTGAGTYTFNVSDFETDQTDAGNIFIGAALATLKVDFTVYFSSYESGQVPQVRVQTRLSNTPGNLFTTVANSTVLANPFTGVASTFNNPIQIPILYPAAGADTEIEVRLQVGAAVPDEEDNTVNYYIQQFRIQRQFDIEDTVGQLVTGGTITLTQTPVLANKGVSPSANQAVWDQITPLEFGKAMTTTFLMSTGSDSSGNNPDLNPKRIIGRSVGIIGAVTGSGLLTFPDGIINKIERTSSVSYDVKLVEPPVMLVTQELRWVNPNYIGNGETITSSSLSSAEFTKYKDGLNIPVKSGTEPQLYDNVLDTISSITIESSSTGETLENTFNSSGSMFFPLYQFEGVFGKKFIQRNGFDILPNNNDTYPIIQLTNSIGASDASGYNLTGSIEIWRGNRDNIGSLGTRVFNAEFLRTSSSGPVTSNGTGTVSVSGSVGLGASTFKHDDVYRMAVKVDKKKSSKLDITEYTMSLFPSESKFATITENFSLFGEGEYGDIVYGGNSVITSPGYNKFSPPTSTEVILSSYYGAGVLPFAIMLDCQPLINNYNLQRENSYLMDIDYSTSEGSEIEAVGNFTENLSQFTLIDSNVTSSIKVGQNISYDNSQFDGNVKVTGINGLVVSVSERANSNAGNNQTIRFKTPTFGSLFPVNFEQILDRTAVKATVPDSNYTQTPWAGFRYNGVKTISNEYNRWTPNDQNTYGQLPVIELRTAYFGYFNSIKDLYPLINDATKTNLTYFIDSQGNALPPNLESGFGKVIIERAFSPGDEVTFSLITGSTELNDLDPETTLLRVGETPFPVLYTQNGAKSYVTDLQLTGSGRLSLYDDGDSNTIETYTFTAEGTSSWDHGTTPTPATTEGEPNFLFTTLNPGEHFTSSYAGYNEYTASYTASGADSGSITFRPDAVVGSGTTDLKNPQFISFQTSFATSFLYEGYRRRRNDGQELKIQIQMEVDGEGQPFVLEDVKLRVHKLGGTYLDLGSIIGAGKGTSRHELVRFVSTKQVKIRRRTYTRNVLSTDQGYNSVTKSYYLTIENPALEAFMRNRGAYSGGGDVQKDGDITFLEWIITGNSGEHIFQRNTTTKFKVGLSMLKSVKNQSNTFFPAAFSGPKFPTKISMVGALDHKLENANTASAPFWVYTGSMGGTAIDQSILVMTSSLINEAFGNNFYQGTVPYVPGSSDFFPNGQEPKGTQIGKVESQVIIEPGDEIRFQNNENYSYKITKVVPPQENIESDGKGRIKIHLDRKVAGGVNKDFFLIRRYKESPTSFILAQEFPYNTVQSASIGSGILYPEFPASNLEVSASKIVTDLVSKGIIT